MKIKDLDRNEVYDLTEIKKDAVKFDALKEWLEKNCHKWTEDKSTRLHICDSLKYNLTYEMWYMSNGEPTKCALTLFELDIADYQVDCSELNKEQFEKLKPSVEKYIIEPSNSAFLKDLVISKFPYCETTTRRIKEGVFSTLIGMELVIKDNSWYFQEVEKKEKSPYNVISCNQGYKESENKCNYELDFEFIRDLAMRIQNEPKYEPYNWKKPMDVEQLSNAMLRHAIEVKKGNFDDNGELGHILAIACNAMFIYHQKKHHND